MDKYFALTVFGFFIFASVAIFCLTVLIINNNPYTFEIGPNALKASENLVNITNNMEKEKNLELLFTAYNDTSRIEPPI